jgi:hypothetical protein
MREVLGILPLHAALAELEFAAVLVLLAEQEAQPVATTLPRLRSAISAVHDARELAVHLLDATGRAPLRVLTRGTESSADAPDAA